MDEPKTLGPLLNCASHLFRERCDARLVKYDVTPVQAHVIIYLHHHGGQVTQQSLGERLRVKPSTVNGIVDRMVERGFVTRSADESDARRRHIALTQEGTIQVERFRCELQNTEHIFDSTFTPEELGQFQSLLLRVIQKLEEDRTK